MFDDWRDLLHGVTCVVCGRAGRSLCRSCEQALPRQAQVVRPVPCPPGLAPSRAVAAYDGAVRELIVAHKEHRIFGLAAVLGRLLAIAVEATDIAVPTVLVPVPTRASVTRARGHDPTLRLVRAAAATLRGAGAPVRCQSLLEHRLPVRDQAGLSAAERRNNRLDTLRLMPGRRRCLEREPRLPRIVICDDVLTTGATARETQRALEDAGVAVAAIATIAATRRRFR